MERPLSVSARGAFGPNPRARPVAVADVVRHGNAGCECGSPPVPPPMPPREHGSCARQTNSKGSRPRGCPSPGSLCPTCGAGQFRKYSQRFTGPTRRTDAGAPRVWSDTNWDRGAHTGTAGVPHRTSQGARQTSLRKIGLNHAAAGNRVVSVFRLMAPEGARPAPNPECRQPREPSLQLPARPVICIRCAFC